MLQLHQYLLIRDSSACYQYLALRITTFRNTAVMNAFVFYIYFLDSTSAADGYNMSLAKRILRRRITRLRNLRYEK